MILRMLNFVVIGALIFAAAYVYRIKFDSTVQAERLAKIRGEVRRERDAIAALRANWGELDNPARIEALAKRYLPAQADRADPIRPARSAAGASAANRQARQRRSDRRRHRDSGGACPGDGQHLPPAAAPSAGRRKTAAATIRRRPARRRPRPSPGGSTDERDHARGRGAAAESRPAIDERPPESRNRGGAVSSAGCSTATMSIAPPRRGRASDWRSSPSPRSI